MCCVLGRVEQNLDEHCLGGNTQRGVLRLHTANNTQIRGTTQMYKAQHKTKMEQERIFYYFSVQKLRLAYTSFPCPYIGYGRLRLSVNRFLSLTPSHHYLCRNAFPSEPTLSFRYALRFALFDLVCSRPLSATRSASPFPTWFVRILCPLRSDLVCLVFGDSQH